VIDLVVRTGTATLTIDFEVIANFIPEEVPETLLCGDCEKRIAQAL